MVRHQWSLRALVVCGALASACATPVQQAAAQAPTQAAPSADPAEGSSGNALDDSGPASTGVDLTITQIFWSPGRPKAGQPLTFSATVKNRGTVATDDGVIIGVAFQINGMTVTWSDNNKSSLGPGQSRKLTANFGPGESATWTAVAGEHTLSAWVDDVNRLPDTNRDNNTNGTQLVVQ
jgi:hypothetical protein